MMDMSRYEVEAVRLTERRGKVYAERAPGLDRVFGNPVHAVEYMDTTSRGSEEVYGWTVREVAE